MKLQRQRRATNAKQKQQLKPLKILAAVTRAERHRRDIGGLKRNRGKAHLKSKRYVSYPAAIGVTRRRRVFSATASAEIKTRGLLHRTAAQMRKEAVKLSLQHKLVSRVRRNSIKLLSRNTVCENSAKTTRQAGQRLVQIKSREIIETKTQRAAVPRTLSLNALRPRLPATGRTRNTFDALLRKHYSRNVPTAYKKKISK